ncbi:hypothetical protein GCM10007108_14120 [Thermogymnomonas acidicola]|uniref:Uncharacterized protein n=1 Tax=Thermogymnomonas acidicola TaxID=399579 RepID=A0AA37BS54_9ARCH|nr:hypothetical protein GCM10007108_14120 [Thermogymnomonas acidicola]
MVNKFESIGCLTFPRWLDECLRTSGGVERDPNTVDFYEGIVYILAVISSIRSIGERYGDAKSLTDIR